MPATWLNFPAFRTGIQDSDASAIHVCQQRNYVGMKLQVFDVFVLIVYSINATHYISLLTACIQTQSYNYFNGLVIYAQKSNRSRTNLINITYSAGRHSASWKSSGDRSISG